MDNDKGIYVKMPADLMAKIKEFSSLARKSQQQFIRDAISKACRAEYLRQRREKAKDK